MAVIRFDIQAGRQGVFVLESKIKQIREAISEIDRQLLAVEAGWDDPRKEIFFEQYKASRKMAEMTVTQLETLTRQLAVVVEIFEAADMA